MLVRIGLPKDTGFCFRTIIYEVVVIIPPVIHNSCYAAGAFLRLIKLSLMLVRITGDLPVCRCTWCSVIIRVRMAFIFPDFIRFGKAAGRAFFCLSILSLMLVRIRLPENTGFCFWTIIHEVMVIISPVIHDPCFAAGAFLRLIELSLVLVGITGNLPVCRCAWCSVKIRERMTFVFPVFQRSGLFTGAFLGLSILSLMLVGIHSLENTCFCFRTVIYKGMGFHFICFKIPGYAAMLSGTFSRLHIFPFVICWVSGDFQVIICGRWIAIVCEYMAMHFEIIAALIHTIIANLILGNNLRIVIIVHMLAGCRQGSCFYIFAGCTLTWFDPGCRTSGRSFHHLTAPVVRFLYPPDIILCEVAMLAGTFLVHQIFSLVLDIIAFDWPGGIRKYRFIIRVHIIVGMCYGIIAALSLAEILNHMIIYDGRMFIIIIMVAASRNGDCFHHFTAGADMCDKAIFQTRGFLFYFMTPGMLFLPPRFYCHCFFITMLPAVTFQVFHIFSFVLEIIFWNLPGFIRWLWTIARIFVDMLIIIRTSRGYTLILDNIIGYRNWIVIIVHMVAGCRNHSDSLFHTARLTYIFLIPILVACWIFCFRFPRMKI